MMKKVSVSLGVILATTLCTPSFAENFTLEQVVQRTVDTFPTLEVANMEVQQAMLERPKVESGLGWVLKGQTGFSHDLSQFGTPADNFNANVGAEKRLPNGDLVGVNSGYGFSDSSIALSPAFPNPSHTTNLDLTYRMPLMQGKGYPLFTQGLANADAGVEIATANQLVLRDQLAQQSVELFYGATLTRARIMNAKQAIERAERLTKYVKENADLGLSEDKDLLQVDAQLRAQVAEHRALEVVWRQQLSGLNRLMGRPTTAAFVPEISDAPAVMPVADDRGKIMEEIEAYNPDLRRLRAQVAIADAAIARARDAKRDSLDAVFGIGTRTNNGDSQTGTVSEQDLAGAVRLEYRRAMDPRGLNADLAKAQLDRSITNQRIANLRRDLAYQVDGLLAEIDAASKAVDGYRLRLTAEERKLDEAEKRYRTGRADTQQLLQFESDLYFTQLAVEQERIELARKTSTLDLMRGNMWKRVVPLDSVQPVGREAGQ